MIQTKPDTFLPFTIDRLPGTAPVRQPTAKAAPKTPPSFRPITELLHSREHDVPLVSPPPQASPSVNLRRDGERVSHIHIKCGCGQVIELACDYENGQTAPDAIPAAS